MTIKEVKSTFKPFVYGINFLFLTETSFMPPKLVIEMLPDENLSLFERIKNSFPSVKRKTSDGSTSAASDTEDRRDSIKSNFSFSSVDLTNRRASSASTFGNQYNQH